MATASPADQLDGAPAYLVWKHSRELAPISWADNPTLAERERLWQQAQQRVGELLAEPLTLARLRATHPTRPLPALTAQHRELLALPTATQAVYLAQLANAGRLAARRWQPLPGEPA